VSSSGPAARIAAASDRRYEQSGEAFYREMARRGLEGLHLALQRHPVFVRFRPDKTPRECYVGEKEHAP
jgi:hypothetical protein